MGAGAETLPGLEHDGYPLTGWEVLEFWAQTEELPLVSGLQDELPGLEEVV